MDKIGKSLLFHSINFFFPKIKRSRSLHAKSCIMFYTTTIAIMISITTVIQCIYKYNTQIYMQIQIQYRKTLLFQIWTGLLTSSFGPCWPHQCVVHLVMFKISVGRDPKISLHLSTVKIQLYASMAETQLSASMVQSQLTLFSKSSNSQDYLFWA